MKNQAFAAILCIILVNISVVTAMGTATGSTTAQSIISLQGTIAHVYDGPQFLDVSISPQNVSLAG